MRELAALWWIGSWGVAAWAVITLPTWLLTSLNRGALWRLRDAVYDARRTGLLSEGPDSQMLIDRLESSILAVPYMTPFMMWRATRHEQGGEPRVNFITLDGRTPSAQSELFSVYQTDLARIMVRQYLTGSWTGLALTCSRHRRLARYVLSNRAWRQVARRLVGPSTATSEGNHRTAPPEATELFWKVARAAPMSAPAGSSRRDDLVAAGG